MADMWGLQDQLYRRVPGTGLYGNRVAMGMEGMGYNGFGFRNEWRILGELDGKELENLFFLFFILFFAFVFYCNSSCLLGVFIVFFPT
jgi:hypothetical protein